MKVTIHTTEDKPAIVIVQGETTDSPEEVAKAYLVIMRILKEDK